jgi:Ca2+-binding RTX toxin-like protein
MALQVGHYKVTKASSYWPQVGKREIHIGTINNEIFSYSERFSNSDISVAGFTWGIPSVAIGGDGNDSYNIWGARVYSIIADASRLSNQDSVNYMFPIKNIQHFFSIEGRHAFISTVDGGFSVIVDALNSKGAIETITFSDVSISNTPNVLSQLLADYRTKSDQSFDQLIQDGLFNPAVMGLVTASDVRNSIDAIYVEMGVFPDVTSTPQVVTDIPSNYKYSATQSTARNFVSSWLPVWQAGALLKVIENESLGNVEINASSWSQVVKLNSVAQIHNKASYSAPQSDIKGPPEANFISGSAESDELSGRAGWDIIDGASGNDLIRGGNGRDILSGGLGKDEIHGDFGWNTYKSEKGDMFSDLIAIKSDEWLVNWLYGKAGNNSDGAKCDIIEGLDDIDRIVIIGCATSDLSFASTTAKGLTGIGIYAKGALEALYTGADLSLSQIQAMTTGDASATAMANQITSYGWTG